jgi:hypothetical protein
VIHMPGSLKFVYYSERYYIETVSDVPYSADKAPTFAEGIFSGLVYCSLNRSEVRLP